MLDRSTAVQLLPIRKMKRALRFYTKTLGAKVIARGELEMSDWWAALRLGGQEFWLVAPEKQEPRKLAYTTFVVKDIRTTVKALQRRKVRFTAPEKMPETKSEGPIAVSPWGSSAFFYDSEKNLLMLWQNP